MLRGGSVGLHLGQIGHGIVTVDSKLSLDAKHRPAIVDEFLEPWGTGVIHVAAGVFSDSVVVDVLVHQNRRLDSRLHFVGP